MSAIREAIDRLDTRRRDMNRRKHRALLDGGRPPHDVDWNEALDKARALARGRRERISMQMANAAIPTDAHVAELLAPYHVQVPADMLLGLEVRICELTETLDRLGVERLETQELLARARVARIDDTELARLERALETGGCLPRNSERLLLEAVRELMHWHRVAA